MVTSISLYGRFDRIERGYYWIRYKAHVRILNTFDAARKPWPESAVTALWLMTSRVGRSKKNDANIDGVCKQQFVLVQSCLFMIDRRRGSVLSPISYRYNGLPAVLKGIQSCSA